MDLVMFYLKQRCVIIKLKNNEIFKLHEAIVS